MSRRYPGAEIGGRRKGVSSRCRVHNNKNNNVLCDCVVWLSRGAVVCLSHDALCAGGHRFHGAVRGIYCGAERSPPRYTMSDKNVIYNNGFYNIIFFLRIGIFRKRADITILMPYKIDNLGSRDLYRCRRPSSSSIRTRRQTAPFPTRLNERALRSTRRTTRAIMVLFI